MTRNDDIPLGAKLAYIALTTVTFVAVMAAFAYWVVRPLQDWVKVAAAGWPPEVTFGICFVLIPILWIGGVRLGKRTGWI